MLTDRYTGHLYTGLQTDRYMRKFIHTVNTHTHTPDTEVGEKMCTLYINGQTKR